MINKKWPFLNIQYKSYRKLSWPLFFRSRQKIMKGISRNRMQMNQYTSNCYNGVPWPPLQPTYRSESRQAAGGRGKVSPFWIGQLSEAQMVNISHSCPQPFLSPVHKLNPHSVPQVAQNFKIILLCIKSNNVKLAIRTTIIPLILSWPGSLILKVWHTSDIVFVTGHYNITWIFPGLPAWT